MIVSIQDRAALCVVSLVLAMGPSTTGAASESADIEKADIERADIEEIVVRGDLDSRVIELSETVDVSPDSAALLRKVAGANVVSNGPLTGMAQYRGMSRFRVSSQVDGAVISPGGPNWMDPPLSYAPAANLETLEVYRGIAPVSAGQETIGGAVNASTWSGEFADPEGAFSGRARTGYQTVNAGWLASAALVLANDSHRLKLSGLGEGGDDAEFSQGEIEPSEYRRDRYDLGYGFRRGSHTLQIDYARNETGDAGTAALPMDIQFIDADLYRLGWKFEGQSMELEARLYGSNIDHGMSNFHLRTPPMAGAMFRRNIADARNVGFALQLSTAGWRFGVDGHDARHNSRIDNPENPAFFVDNFNDAERRVVGVYAERELQFDSGVTLEIGARYNRVSTNADPVDATPAVMGMPPAVALRDTFNNADRSRNDNNVDWVLKAYYPAAPGAVLYAGVARKSRSASHQERYLWLPLQATAGLADGRTYVGNPGLDPEVAHEVEVGIDWQHGSFFASPRLFYRRVNDYIQGTPAAPMPAVMFVDMMNAANGTGNAPPLQFNNVDAVFYGADIDWRYAMAKRWALEGVVNIVRGERDDIDDNLYRVAAPNAFTSLNYLGDQFSLSLETFLYAEQDNVSATNGELTSDDYVLVNLKGSLQLAEQARLSLGIDNLFDENYEDHLAGVNRVRGNPDIAVGERLPGHGRSFTARFDFNW
ncbi:MAG: TonB-dependent receptor [Halioglobus sp.]|nr:TonB-dependent receptor [Halioglobus sp.]